MNRQQTNPSHRNPFWNPWGAWGCLWRTLLFLLGLLFLCLLFSMLFRGCDAPINNPFQPREDVGHEGFNPYRNLPRELRDSSLVDDWHVPIPNVPELPAPEDNFIPPVDSTRIVVNPDDSLSYIVCDQLIVFFNSQDLPRDMADFAQRFKQCYQGPAYEIAYYNPVIGTMLLLVPEEELLQIADELPQRIPGIDFRVATNDILEESAKPGDPGFAKAKYDEYYKLIQAYEAWDITKGSPDVKVAIVDSYFDLTNPEIGERYVDRIHIPSKTKMVLPPAQAPDQNTVGAYCHGSHVAGIAIGGQNNNLGCSGIAPGCTWIPISLGDQLTSFNILEGILYAVYKGADVVNFSLGRAFPKGVSQVPIDEQIAVARSTDKRGEALWEYIVKTANDHNCVLCTAAGNETILMGLDPKNRSMQMIKVEAVDGKGQKADFSNFGEVPGTDVNYSTVSAPGVDLWSVSDKRCASIWKANGYVVSQKDGLQEMSGTSMAAPVVAGAAALLKSKNKNLTTEQIIKILAMTAKQFDTTHRIGPTIQIRDALDATGGDLANFDDLMEDHNLLVGKWKSTHELAIFTQGPNEEKVDDMWTYFIFTSPTSGQVKHHTINKRTVYTARLKVTWEENRIIINQLEQAATPDGDKLIKDDFICTPNADRLLNATCIKQGNKEAFDFQLEKVN